MVAFKCCGNFGAEMPRISVAFHCPINKTGFQSSSRVTNRHSHGQVVSLLNKRSPNETTLTHVNANWGDFIFGKDSDRSPPKNPRDKELPKLDCGLTIFTTTKAQTKNGGKRKRIESSWDLAPIEWVAIFPTFIIKSKLFPTRTHDFVSAAVAELLAPNLYLGSCASAFKFMLICFVSERRPSEGIAKRRIWGMRINQTIDWGWESQSRVQLWWIFFTLSVKIKSAFIVCVWTFSRCLWAGDGAGAGVGVWAAVWAKSVRSLWLFLSLVKCLSSDLWAASGRRFRTDSHI